MSTSETENLSNRNTSIVLHCDWNGNFHLTDPEGIKWFYSRDRWNECSKHMREIVKPAQGDPK